LAMVALLQPTPQLGHFRHQRQDSVNQISDSPHAFDNAKRDRHQFPYPQKTSRPVRASWHLGLGFSPRKLRALWSRDQDMPAPFRQFHRARRGQFRSEEWPHQERANRVRGDYRPLGSLRSYGGSCFPPSIPIGTVSRSSTRIIFKLRHHPAGSCLQRRTDHDLLGRKVAHYSWAHQPFDGIPTLRRSLALERHENHEAGSPRCGDF
jgi:hypothetical protein